MRGWEVSQGWQGQWTSGGAAPEGLCTLLCVRHQGPNPKAKGLDGPAEDRAREALQAGTLSRVLQDEVNEEHSSRRCVGTGGWGRVGGLGGAALKGFKLCQGGEVTQQINILERQAGANLRI